MPTSRTSGRQPCGRSESARCHCRSPCPRRRRPSWSPPSSRRTRSHARGPRAFPPGRMRSRRHPRQSRSVSRLSRLPVRLRSVDRPVPTTNLTRREAVPRTGAEVRFFNRVYAIVREIPRGRVATYGQVAFLAGVPRGARAVGWALRALTPARATEVPWQRVVGAGGCLARHLRARQARLLRAEGVAAEGGVVDVARFGLGRDGRRPAQGRTRGRPWEPAVGNRAASILRRRA
jgi:methylated-DNA-protein-cysteine methyltransferase-like protein